MAAGIVSRSDMIRHKSSAVALLTMNDQIVFRVAERNTGRPLAGAAVNAGPRSRGGFSAIGNFATDEEGQCIIPVPDGPSHEGVSQ